MGYYINPADMSKESWLSLNGRRISQLDVGNFDFSGDELPVCLVNNGAFTAAGIAYDKSEAQAFNNPSDARPKIWYAVKRELLLPWYK